jgi:hypothetical protein
MKLTIIVEDNAVYVNNLSRILDLSQCAIPSDIHALQWKETAGWVEFVDNFDGTKPQNEFITELPVWANACVEVWNAWTPPILVQPVPVEPIIL